MDKYFFYKLVYQYLSKTFSIFTVFSKDFWVFFLSGKDSVMIYV